MRTGPEKSTQTKLIEALKSRSRIEAFEAAKQINKLDDNAMVRPTISVLQNGKRPFNRAAAAYAMQGCSTPSAIKALEQTLRNKSENVEVRGQAAETLAHCHRRATHNLLLKTVLDRSKDVRFWCAFALGQMREKKAIPLLRLLLNDQRAVRGFHSVAKEAADAITEISAQQKTRRCSYCLR